MSYIQWDTPIKIDQQPLSASLDERKITNASFSLDNEQGRIWRTRSLDEAGTSHVEGISEKNQFKERQSNSEALHSSFDASLLKDDRNYASIFRFSSDQGSQGTHTPNSTQDDPELGELSGRKHLLQRAATELAEQTNPGIVRKLPRHSTKESTGGKIPIIPRIRSKPTVFREKFGSPTPFITRRSRTPPRCQKSPLRCVPPTTPRELQTNPSPRLVPSHVTSSTKALSNGAFGLSGTPSEGIKETQASTPARDLTNSAFPTCTVKSSQVFLTGATAASTIDTSAESESDGTSSPTATSFRFTSFPASLPRISSHRSTRPRPDSVRKRMSFGECAPQNLVNLSRDDNGTQNTSMSSLSVDGAQNAVCNKIQEAKSTRIGTSVEQLLPTHPIDGKLFLDDLEFGYSSDDDSVASPIFGFAEKTRLNFNLVLSPLVQSGEASKEARLDEGDISMQFEGDNAELSHPYEQHRISSFPSTISSHTPLRSISRCDKNSTASTIGLTPFRSGGEIRMENQSLDTLQDVHLHFQLNAAQCSPISGTREEEVGNVPVITRERSFSIGKGIDCSGESTIKSIEGRSISGDSATSASTNSRLRRLRPLPDMSAFENDAMSSSRHDRSGDESAAAESKSNVSSPVFLCPPTPVRTPAWAHSDSEGPSTILQRSNSLISTMVLATCSPQMLDLKCSAYAENHSNESFQIRAEKFGVRRNQEQNFEAGLSVGKQVDSEARTQDISEQHSKMFSEVSESTIKHLPLLPRYTTGEVGSYISFSTDFEILSLLGSGAFADVYKVRSKLDDRLYAVKKNRRIFRGKRDRDMALAEVKCMQRLQSMCADSEGINYEKKESNIQYLLFFFRAWQEDGYFFCQTELCCRDSCRELMDSLRSRWNWAKTRYSSLLRNLKVPEEVTAGSNFDTVGRLVPETTIWKVCHDISAGLSQIHSHGFVHDDIKPSNIFFVSHRHYGTLCKIGDFGMAAEIGTSEDGQEGDQKYMAPELLTSGVKKSSADIFSLGLTLYELASDASFELPSGGSRWHDLRNGSNLSELPACRTSEITNLIQTMIQPQQLRRPNAEAILNDSKVKEAGRKRDEFLIEYIRDVGENDKQEEEMKSEMNQMEELTPRNGNFRVRVQSPVGSMLPLPKLCLPNT